MKRDGRPCHVLDVRNPVVALEAPTKLDLYFSNFGRSHVPAMQMQGLHTGVKKSAPDVLGRAPARSNASAKLSSRALLQFGEDELGHFAERLEHAVCL